ncbi:MAG: TIGR03643 family protein [Pseudomonadota bacterium]
MVNSEHETRGFSDSEIIAMAWDDETSFDAIERATGLAEKQVIQLMRANMKPSSFRMWRKRVSGRKTKHDQKMR